jgi:Thoeris protein ThsB, TIR-like domain
MPELKTYDLFISHAWAYHEDYLRLEKMLRDAPYFKWRNYSVPKHDPLIDPGTTVGKSKLLGMLDNQVRPVNCTLVLSGMYAAHRDWIQSEIDLAKKYGKPIVGVIPWGQERVPLSVQEAAHEMVRWNTSSVIEAIRKWSL